MLAQLPPAGPLEQLFGSFFGMLFVLALLVWLCTPLLWTWLAFRFFRDVHQIRESLEWIAYAQRKVAESDKPAVAPAMISQFGR